MTAPAYDPFDATTEKRIPIVATTEMQRLLVYRMAQRFKDISPQIASRIDAAAAELTGKSWAKKVVSLSDPLMGGATNQPAINIESEAGQGKTHIVREAARRFCEIAGLNFIESPPDYYVPNKDDFYFFSVNMIGQHNPSEAGGLPIRLSLGENKSDVSLIDALRNRIEGIADMVEREVDFATSDHSGLDVAELAVTFEREQVAQKSARKVQEWAAKILKESGARLVVLGDDDKPADNEFAIRTKLQGGTLVVQYYEPKKALREMSVMGKLPNAAWAKASRAAGCVMHVDEVDKISPAIRHLLLEIAQFGKVSGTANLGEHYMVVMTGNLGDRGEVNDFNDSISHATVAEGTRMERYRMVSTPEEWAEYIDLRYPGTDNAHITSFVRRYGDQKNIFRPDYSDPDFDPSKPCSNARALENAMIAAKQAFLEADYSGAPRSVVYDDPDFSRTMLALAGADFANAYVGHVKAMETMAVPLADHIFEARSEKLDDIEAAPLDIPGIDEKSFISVMEKKTGSFSYLDPEHMLFAQRLSDALVSRTVAEYIKTDAEDRREDVLAKGFAGLALLSKEAHNAGVALINNHLRKLEVGNDDARADNYISVVGGAIGRVLKSGFHHVPGLTKEQQKARLRDVELDISETITGHRTNRAPSPAQ